MYAGANMDYLSSPLHLNSASSLGQLCNNLVISTGAYPDSYFAELTTTTYAAIRRESRKNFINATEFDRKSGGV
jgi:hypothetical protein